MSYVLSLFIVLLGPLVDHKVLDTPQFKEALATVAYPLQQAQVSADPLARFTEDELFKLTEPKPMQMGEIKITGDCPPSLSLETCAHYRNLGYTVEDIWYRKYQHE